MPRGCTAEGEARHTMNQAATPVSHAVADARAGADPVAPDCRGLNFYAIDRGFCEVLKLYLEPTLHAHLEPHLQRLGELAGGRLDELAEQADKHEPVLHRRDRFGRDADWIEYHPAYREMERIAFDDFGLHVMSHRGGVLGWPEPFPPLAKYAVQYLFVQAEFGLLCPVSVTDTSAMLIRRYAADEIRERYLPRMLAEMRAQMWTGAQFMTEKIGGSDVSRVEVRAVPEGDHWRIHGDKWFCSHADADLILMLARPDGAPDGNAGLGLFLVPRQLEDGTRNAYRIIRLKDKLGSRSMASGEVTFEGAVGYHLGELNRGLKQMMDQVNLSRLSHGVRAAGMMRRCVNEALQVARHRTAFGQTLIEMPLVRRQLMKLILPTEQALSMWLFTARTMERAQAGDATAVRTLRIVTPLLKFRACRDNIPVATGAMEMRGGNGYIEDWINARLVRDAHLGVLWEGTSNINALDVTTRAIRKERAHEALAQSLHEQVDDTPGLPGQFGGRISDMLDRAVQFADTVAAAPEGAPLARRAADALYHATSAALLAWEAATLGSAGGDARRLILSRLVLDHRLGPDDPLRVPDAAWDAAVADAVLGAAPVTLARAGELASA